MDIGAFGKLKAKGRVRKFGDKDGQQFSQRRGACFFLVGERDLSVAIAAAGLADNRRLVDVDVEVTKVQHRRTAVRAVRNREGNVARTIANSQFVSDAASPDM